MLPFNTNDMQFMVAFKAELLFFGCHNTLRRAAYVILNFVLA